MRAPTRVRWMNDREWRIVTRVFGSTLPFRQRIFITDALGGGNAPFTIPTSLVRSLPAVLGGAFTGTVLGGPAGGAALATITGALAHVSSLVNIGYLMNIGPGDYADMAASDQPLLVHETAHVWQGKNSWFAMSYAIESALHQCAGILGGSGRGTAYNYTAGSNWSSYNPEQQASIIEDWFRAGEPASGSLWPYVRDYVRKGRV